MHLSSYLYFIRLQPTEVSHFPSLNSEKYALCGLERQRREHLLNHTHAWSPVKLHGTYGACWTGTPHWNLNQSVVRTRRVAYFIMLANRGNCVTETYRTWKVRRGFGNNEGEWIGDVYVMTRKKLLAVGEACVAIFWPKRRASASSGFSTEVTFMSASAVLLCRRVNGTTSEESNHNKRSALV